MTIVPKDPSAAQDRYIRDPDRLLGRTFDLFGGGVVRVLEHWPATETRDETISLLVLDTREHLHIPAKLWRDLEGLGAAYEV